MIKNRTYKCMAMSAIILTCTSAVFAQSGGNAVSPNAEQISLLEGKIRRQGEWVDFQKKQIALQVQKLVKCQGKVAKISSDLAKVGVSVESFPEIVKSMQSRRIDLFINQAGIDAKLAKLQSILSTNASVSQSANKKVLVKLEQIYDLQKKEEQALKQLLAKGTKSQSELFALKKEMLETELKIQQVQMPSGNSNLTDRYTEWTLEAAGNKAKLDALDSMLPKIHAERGNITELVDLRLVRNELLKNLKESKKLLHNEEVSLGKFQNQLQQLNEGKSDF